MFVLSNDSMFSDFVIIGRTEAGLQSCKYCLEQLLFDCYWEYEKLFNISAICVGFQLKLAAPSWLEVKLPNMLFLDSYNKPVKVSLTLMHYRR